MTPSFTGPILGFLAVIALIPIALWLLKRTPLGAGAAGASGLRVVGSLALAPNQRIITVEVGSGEDRRWLVLGVSAGQIQTLHTLPPQAEPPAPAAGAGSPFAALLTRQMGDKTGRTAGEPPSPGTGGRDAA